MKRTLKIGGVTAALLLLAAPAYAQDGMSVDDLVVATTVQYLMLATVLVFIMHAGYAMLQAGLTPGKNVANIIGKNLLTISVGMLAYYAIGWGLMYGTQTAGLFGTDGVFLTTAPYDVTETGYTLEIDFAFQAMFAATAATIVSGAVAERMKFGAYVAVAIVMTGIIYPIVGHWTWGGGWVSGIGFTDFAGSTIVHSVGGWAALAGAIVVGARTGKYGADGSVFPIPGSNMALATLGVFILWLGWFGFNGASQLAMGTNADISDVSRIFANTNLAAAGGVVAALILTQLVYGKVDITMVLNGALAGLVSITAEPLTPGPFAAILIGAVGGAIVVFTVPLLDKLKVDDVVGAIPVHLLAGIWGTIVVPVTNDGASFGTQIIGIVAMGAFAFITSFIVWTILKVTIGVRVSPEDEMTGLDVAEIGVEAYPEFSSAR